MWAKYKQGFTIVELLIVIVVIGILAAISIVAYNGIQDRGRLSKYQTDLGSIHKALQLYYADNGNYPATTSGGWQGWDQLTGNSFISGLSPTYIQTIPQMDTSLPSNDTYIYQSLGLGYQLIRFRSNTYGGLPQTERNGPRAWPGSTAEGWGYWTSNYYASNAVDTP